MSRKDTEVITLNSGGSPSASSSRRFAVDQLLRKAGYSIHSRKKGEEPEWILSGVIFKQSDAVKRIDCRVLRDAVYLEECERGWR